MAKSQETFNKKEVRTRKEKKRKEKDKKREKRKSEGKKGSFDEMIAYVDEFGRITSTPPDPGKKIEIAASDIEYKVSRNKQQPADIIRKGVVVSFNESKGYGFIRDMESDRSIFFHVKNTEEQIRENNIVNFEIEKGPKGPSANKVRLFRE